MPGRYAKFEASTGFIDSIDRYAYREPNADGGAAIQSEIVEAVPASAAESAAEKAGGASDANGR